MSRRVTESQKKVIASRQGYKCRRIPGYECPFYKNGQDGTFDESGYEIDHINEFSLTQDDSQDNLQALCINCHRVKTRRFMNQMRLDKKKEKQKQKKTESNKVKTIKPNAEEKSEEKSGECENKAEEKEIDSVESQQYYYGNNRTDCYNNSIYDNDLKPVNRFNVVHEFKISKNVNYLRDTNSQTGQYHFV